MIMFVPNIITDIPHGSGVNGNWSVSVQKNNHTLVFSNSYHGMTEYGFYDGYADFDLLVPIFSPDEFRVVFHGTGFRRKSWYWDLRDYLEDLFAEWIKQNTLEI